MREAAPKGQRFSCGNRPAFAQVIGLIAMNTRLITGLTISGALLLGGCVTGNRVWPEGTLAPVEEQAGTRRVRIESRPTGALITVEGRVVGHTPIDVIVPVTRLGFFPDTVTIRARFLAEDQSFGPVSVRAQFGVLDRVPAAVVFTPDTFWPVRR